MTPALMSLLMLVVALSVAIFVARRVPSAGAAYALAILAGGLTYVLLFLIATYWLSFLTVNAPIN